MINKNSCIQLKHVHILCNYRNNIKVSQYAHPNLCGCRRLLIGCLFSEQSAGIHVCMSCTGLFHMPREHIPDVDHCSQHTTCEVQTIATNGLTCYTSRAAQMIEWVLARYCSLQESRREIHRVQHTRCSHISALYATTLSHRLDRNEPGLPWVPVTLKSRSLAIVWALNSPSMLRMLSSAKSPTHPCSWEASCLASSHGLIVCACFHHRHSRLQQTLEYLKLGSWEWIWRHTVRSKYCEPSKGATLWRSRLCNKFSKSCCNFAWVDVAKWRSEIPLRQNALNQKIKAPSSTAHVETTLWQIDQSNWCVEGPIAGGRGPSG